MKLTERKEKEFRELMGKIKEEATVIKLSSLEIGIDMFMEMKEISDMKRSVKYLSKLVHELNRKFYRDNQSVVEWD